MKAIYRCKKAYSNIPKDEVNVVLVPCSDDDNFTRYVPLLSYTTEYYRFYEGKNHNELTLTNPVEIRNMREYIRRRNDTHIIEILFEGNEEELRITTASVKQVSCTARNDVKSTRLEYDDLSEWDREMISRLSR